MKERITDDEIIKALECCSKRTVFEECPIECPMYQLDGDCFDLIQKDILDLINRQKAKIEKAADAMCKKEDTTQLIAKERQRYYDELQTANAEVERLQSILLCFMDEVSKWQNKHGLDVSELPLIPIRGESKKIIEQIKAEAIKEFAERLKDVIDYLETKYFDEDITMDEIRGDIDILVKEMVGDTE